MPKDATLGWFISSDDRTISVITSKADKLFKGLAEGQPTRTNK
jgi:hypothetical protein